MIGSSGLYHFALCFVLPLAAQAADRQLPIVKLPYEHHQAISFNETGGYYNFSNIRYGAAPVGNMRFRAPVSPIPLANCTVTNGSQGRVCPQSSGNWTIISQEFYPSYLTGQSFDYDGAMAALPTSPLAVSSDPRTTEDCLFLDVLAPQKVWTEGVTGLPVLVYIYGGGYSSGEKTGYGKFNPAGLLHASNTSFIYAAINYRLGAFGWLAGGQVTADGTPNAGLHDQRLALQWVQQYIHLFGGDPARVTAMGGSAGAGSIMHHITSSGGADSGPFFSQAVTFSPAFLPAPTLDAAEASLAGFLALLGVSSIAEARELSSADLVAANALQIYSQAPYGSNMYGPVVDGTLVPALPGQSLAAGDFHEGVKVLVSHNMLEGLLFTRPDISSAQDYLDVLTAAMPRISEEQLEFVNGTLYPGVFDGSYGYATEFQRAMATIQDSTIVCNPFFLASAMPDRAYGLRFAVPPGIHGQETSYVFQNGATTGVDTGVADALQRYIVSFVTGSVPTSADGMPMPTYGADAAVMVMASSGAVAGTDDAANERCRWWQQGLYY